MVAGPTLTPSSTAKSSTSVAAASPRSNIAPSSTAKAGTVTEAADTHRITAGLITGWTAAGAFALLLTVVSVLLLRRRQKLRYAQSARLLDGAY